MKFRSESEKNKKIMIVCGESSGDLHGSYLVKELLKLEPNADIYGIGGKKMISQGFSAFLKSEDLAFMGITDVLKNLGTISSAKKTAEFILKNKKPDLLILIDYPGFNLKLAEYAKKLKIKVLYYISPKIWAWNMKRIYKLKAFTDHTALIFPFEKEIYDNYEVPATFVGNPLLDYNIPQRKKNTFPQIQKAPVIGLLPGSRSDEILRLLPVLLQTAFDASNDFNEPEFIVSFACKSQKEFFYKEIDKYKDFINIKIETESVYNIFEKVDFLIAASGTVTLEAAIAEIPMIIVYKVSPVTYHAGKFAVKTPFIGLASIIAGREVVPELVQNDAEPENIRNYLLYYLKDEDIYNKTVKDLKEVKSALGSKGVCKRTAGLAIDMAER